MASLRAWASAGPFPGRLMSPCSEKTILTRDRYGNLVETRAVSDAFAGESVETTLTGRYGEQLQETRVLDPYSGRTHVCRLRSESPKSSILRGSLDDPLYRRSVYPSRAWDSAHETRTRSTNGRDTLETTTSDNPVTGDHEVTQRVHNKVTGEDQVIHSVRTPRGERVSTTRSLSPTLTPRIHFDDLLDPRRRVLRENFLLDDLRTKTFNDRLDSGLSKRSLYLDDPQWRRPKTHVDDPLLARPRYYADPLFRQARVDSLYDPLYQHSALDYRLADGLCNDHLHRRTAYAVDDPLYRRSAYLMADPLHRSLQ